MTALAVVVQAEVLAGALTDLVTDGTLGRGLTVSVLVLASIGVVRGLGQGSPAGVTFEMCGALLGRYYFRRRFGDMLEP